MEGEELRIDTLAVGWWVQGNVEREYVHSP